MNTDVMFSSKIQTWETPKHFFELLNKQFDFTLDAAADASNYKVGNYYDTHINALCQKWEGRVFCNPPYGRELYQWVKKAYGESKQEYNELVCLLIPARTDTKYFHEYCKKGIIFFVKGRLKFGNSANSAPFPSMVVIFSKHYIPNQLIDGTGAMALK